MCETSLKSEITKNDQLPQIMEFLIVPREMQVSIEAILCCSESTCKNKQLIQLGEYIFVLVFSPLVLSFSDAGITPTFLDGRKGHL